MKKFIFFLFCFSFVELRALSAAETADEQLMRPALLTHLLNDSHWTEEQLDAISSDSFNLCVYKHFPTYRGFSRHLGESEIRQRKTKIIHVSSVDEISKCHAIYVRPKNQSEAANFVKYASDSPGILIGEGRNVASSGFHFGIFIGSNNLFEFDINLDEFARTDHFPSTMLVELGSLVRTEIVQKANLMRSLIGYTKWPKESPLNAELVVCAEKRNSFTEYSRYLLNRKPLKDRNTIFKYLEDKQASENASDNCNVVLFSESSPERFKSLVYNRDVNSILLIGDAEGLGEKGVHYNLQLPEGEGKHRFEMNLLALDQTGHEPHFQLLNSALIVSRDIPRYSQLLTKAVKLTQWPEAEKALKSVNLCLWQADKEYKSLIFFDSEIKKKHQKLKIQSIKKESEIKQCNAMLISDVATQDLGLIQQLQEQYGFLLISNQSNAHQSGAHYNLNVAPKRITLELFEDNLKKSGFIPQKALRDLGVIIGGDIQ